MDEPNRRIPFWKIVIGWLVGLVALGISPMRDSIVATIYQWSILFVFVGLFVHREGAPRLRRSLDGAIQEFRLSNSRRFAVVTRWALIGTSLVVGLFVAVGVVYFCLWAWAMSRLQ